MRPSATFKLTPKRARMQSGWICLNLLRLGAQSFSFLWVLSSPMYNPWSRGKLSPGIKGRCFNNACLYQEETSCADMKEEYMWWGLLFIGIIRWQSWEHSYWLIKCKTAVQTALMLTSNNNEPRDDIIHLYIFDFIVAQRGALKWTASFTSICLNEGNIIQK